jgi:hypothetical protein
MLNLLETQTLNKPARVTYFALFQISIYKKFFVARDSMAH